MNLDRKSKPLKRLIEDYEQYIKNEKMPFHIAFDKFVVRVSLTFRLFCLPIESALDEITVGMC